MKEDMHAKLSSRIIGFVSSLILTLFAFALIAYPDFFPFNLTTNVSLLLVFAVLQSVAQSIFFLNVLGERGPRWNLIVFASTLSIILIIVIGAIWIMHHLDTNMMPH